MDAFCRIPRGISGTARRFRREQIQDTVVFFGSARFQGGDRRQKNLTAIEKNDAKIAAR